MPFLRQLYKQKPSAWGPVSAVQASMFKNAEKVGIAPESIALAMPMWCPGDQLDYAKLYQHTSSVAFDKNALSFSGSNQISLDASKLGVKVFTIVPCFRTKSTNPQCLYSECNTSSDMPVKALSLYSDGTIQYLLRRVDSTVEVNIYSKGPSVRDGKNHIVAATYDDGYDGHLYVDGRYIASDSGGAFSVTLNTFTVGSLVRTSTGSYFGGYYNSLFIFHSVLSPSQIYHLSDNPYYLLHRVPPVFYSVPGGAIEFLINNISQGQSISELSLAQLHDLSTANIFQTQSIDSLTLDQLHTLVIENVSQSNVIDAQVLAQIHDIIINNVLQDQSIDALELEIPGILVIYDILQGQTVQAQTLAQKIALTLQDIMQSQGVESASLDQLHQLACDSINQGQSVDTTELEHLISLAVANISQGQILDSPNLFNVLQLNIDDVSQAQSMGMLNFEQVSSLVIDNVYQGNVIQAINFAVIQGKVTITFNIKTPGATFNAKTPEAGFSIN